MIGYFTESAHNYMRENTILFPNYLNPVKTFLIGVIVLITCLPMIFLMFFIGNCLYQIFISKGFGNSVIITSISFTELVLVGILCSQSNLFALTYNPLKAWNIIKIAKSFPDYSLSTFLFLIVGGLFVGFIAFPISYLIHLIFGSGVVYYSVLAFFTVLVLAIYAQYNAQRVLEIPALFYRKMYTNNEEDRFK